MEDVLPKRRTPRQRKMAADAARREAHARLVAQRSQDPRYVHRERSGDDVTITVPSNSRAEADLRAALDGQKERFREQFGREIGPDDPVFWDPDADQPTPMTESRIAQMRHEWAESVARAGMDPAPVLAMRDLGYIVTEENQHLLSLAEVDEYDQAVT
jgi:hypothetical protein